MNEPTADQRDRARRAADAFLERARDFKLGGLVTESPHPGTQGLAETAQQDPAAGVRLICDVDRDLIEPFGEAVRGRAFERLEAAMVEAFKGSGRVFFTGCGATGRLSILLESMWRHACAEHAAGGLADRVISVMAGGDFALIKSVEGYEDHTAFGDAQIGRHEPTADDVVVAITEGGETSFVIGTAWRGVRDGAATFFVYNNPDELLMPVDRSREVIASDAIVKLNLTTGPMAVAGSTRMQATSIQLAVVGAALERAFARASGRDPIDLATYAQRLSDLLDGLHEEASVAAMTRLAEREAELYTREGGPGRVIYLADRLLLDVMTDTTERSPTFSLPPFRSKTSTAEQPASWSFVQDPGRSTPETWRAMLGRPVRGIDWTADDYRGMQAPSAIVDKPPRLDDTAILGFEIGRETDAEAFDLRVALLSRGEVSLAEAEHDVALRIGRDAPSGAASADTLGLDIALPDSPLDWSLRLAAKLVLNAVSTASMAMIGRLTGNWMVHVRCSNLKLIDRGIRLLMHQADMEYETACLRLCESMVMLEDEGGEAAAQSPVADALARHRSSSGSSAPVSHAGGRAGRS
jgi:N-acetylmuramic acid 6-phosphate etherase